MSTYEAEIERANRELDKLVEHFGRDSSAWIALSDALKGGANSTEALAAYLGKHWAGLPKAGDLERALQVITHYLLRKQDVVRYYAKDMQPVSAPSWYRSHHVFIDGPEIKALWGELRSICNNSSLTATRKYNESMEVLNSLRTIILRSAYDQKEGFEDIYTQMREYIESWLGRDYRP